MRDLSSLQRDILYVLSGMDTPNGLAILDELEAYYETRISPGRLYPNLDRLAENGFLDKTQIDKRTNGYSITSQGCRAIDARDEWRQQYLDASVTTSDG